MFLDCGNVGVLCFCILDPYTCGYLDTRICISVYLRCQGLLILPSLYIHICTIYTNRINTHTNIIKMASNSSNNSLVLVMMITIV